MNGAGDVALTHGGDMFWRWRAQREWSEGLCIGLAVLAIGCGEGGTPLTPLTPEPDPAEPPVPTRVEFQTQPTNGHVQAVLAPVEVVVRDDGGVLVSTSSVPVTLTLGTNPSGAVLSGTATVNAVNGIATFSDLTIDRSESYTLIAESPDLASATSGVFDIVFGMQQVSAGIDHTCGLAMSGVTYCWGHNNYGQVGTITSGGETGTPVLASDGHQFTTLIAGGGHTCALTAAGDAYCWGNNVTGQLGDGDAPHHRSTLEPVLGGHVFTSLAASGTHTCGVTSEDDIYCWGYNAQGQLGHPAAGNETDLPVLVEGGHAFTEVAVGDGHTCGLTVVGAAYCWGGNYDGALGDGHAGVDSDVPVAVAGGHVFVDISAGAGHTCGISDTGAAYCWGGNYTGQLGNGNLGPASDVPVAVSGNLTFGSLSEGGAEDGHTCGITTAGDAYCWGDNSRGQLGDGGTEDERAAPGLVAGDLAFSHLTTGGTHTCGLAVNGAVYCWGHNQEGQLGHGTIGEDQAVPVRITDPQQP